MGRHAEHRLIFSQPPADTDRQSVLNARLSLDAQSYDMSGMCIIRSRMAVAPRRWLPPDDGQQDRPPFRTVGT